MEFRELTHLVVVGDAQGAETALRRALNRGAEPSAILERALIPAMDVVGRRFSAEEIYIPEMIVAARAMKRCLGLLHPLLSRRERTSRGTVVIGTVQGDLHDIGKNIVAMMLEGAGFEVHDLGVDVAPRQFVRAVEEHAPDILGLSALLTTTMPMMAAVMEALESAGLRDTVKVMVGGAPLTEDYARKINADGFASDAGAAATRAKELVGLD